MTKLLLILMMVGVWSGCGKEIKVFTKKYPDGEIKEEYQYYNHPDNNRRIKNGWYNSYMIDRVVCVGSPLPFYLHEAAQTV